MDEASFLRFIAREDLLKHLMPSTSLQICLVERSKLIWKEHIQDISNNYSVRCMITILKFFKNSQNLGFKSGQTICELIPEMKQILEKYIGIPDELKTAICDFLAVQCDVVDGIMEKKAVDCLEILSYLAVNSASTWQLKDSALEAISSLLKLRSKDTERDLNSDKHFKEIIRNVILNGLKHGESYVRASAIKLIPDYVSAFKQDIALEHETEMIIKIEEIMLIDQEAIVRRSAIDSMANLVVEVSKESLVQLGILGLHATASDLDWEVKLKSSNFWQKIISRKSGNSEINNLPTNDQLISELESIGALSALLIGCNDFEEPVRNAFYKLTEDTIQKLDLDEHTLNKLRKLDLEDPKGDNVNKNAVDSYEEEDKVDMIDLVVQSQDKDLLKPLTTYELKEDKKTLIK